MKNYSLKIIAISLAILAVIIIAVPAFAGNAAPQMEGCYRCTHCGCSFSNEKKWNKHKDKCFSEVSLPEEPKETSAAIEETETTTETVETTEVTTETTTTTVPSTAVEETTTVVETTTENIVIVPETKPEPPVVEETETTTTTVPSTVVEKTTAAVATTTAVTSTTKVTTAEKEAPVVKITLPDIPEFKLEIPEKVETTATTTTMPDKFSSDEFFGDDIDDSDIETVIPNTGSPKFVAGIAVLAIMAGAVMLVISKKNKNENNA